MYIQDAETTRHILFDQIPRSTIACYLLAEGYESVKKTILGVFNSVGARTKEQLTGAYNSERPSTKHGHREVQLRGVQGSTNSDLDAGQLFASHGVLRQLTLPRRSSVGADYVSTRAARLCSRQDKVEDVNYAEGLFGTSRRKKKVTILMRTILATAKLMDYTRQEWLHDVG